ncbi:hypothetical protein EE612_046023, partial [Oryza sativa]
FRVLENIVTPSKICIGRQSVKSDCIKLYNESKKQLHHHIEKLGSHVSLTADLWTSNHNLWYICVTTHYVNADFELKKFIISFKQISYPHTSYAVQDGLTSCLIEWDLIDKLFTLTLDNASVNDKAAKELRNTMGAEMFFKAEHFHVRCNAHILNIMVQNGTRLITSAIANVRDIVKTITSIPSPMQIFNSVVQRMGLKTKSRLVVDVPHRWNATYDMIHDSLAYKAAINIYATEQHHETPSDSDWGKAESLHGFLQAFSDATKTFSTDRHPTSHLFLKMVLAIRDVLLDERWEQDQLLQEMANAMYVKFQKYWNVPNIVLLVVAVMDPTQKIDYLRFYFYTIGQNVEEKIKELRTCLNKYYLEYEKIAGSCELPTFIERDEHILANDPSSSSLGGALLGKRCIELAFSHFASQNIEMHTKKSELDNYLEDPRVHYNSDENFDVLSWWKRNADVYPTLSLMARDFLAIPVSTVSSESAFSAAGRLLGKDRTSMSPETLEASICLKDWIIGFDDDEKGKRLTLCKGMYYSIYLISFLVLQYAGYATEGSRICDLEDYV